MGAGVGRKEERSTRVSRGRWLSPKRWWPKEKFWSQPGGPVLTPPLATWFTSAGYITAQSLSFLNCKRGYKCMKTGSTLLIIKEM